MQQLVIDRFEGKFAICENADQRYFAIETQELPEGPKKVPSWRFQVRGTFPQSGGNGATPAGCCSQAEKSL